jgi:hypothetical protein
VASAAIDLGEVGAGVTPEAGDADSESKRIVPTCTPK